MNNQHEIEEQRTQLKGFEPIKDGWDGCTASEHYFAAQNADSDCGVSA